VLPGSPARQPELASTILGKDGTEMILVPTGEFTMGSSTPDDIASLLRRNPKANGTILQDEIPKHRVFLEAFYSAWKDIAVDDGYSSTAPVGSYEAGKSSYGAYDTAGNVWEWVADRYDAKSYRRSPTRNPQGPTAGCRWSCAAAPGSTLLLTAV
jgi:formylglycine-generating enzyme required for sulfatase activity